MVGVVNIPEQNGQNKGVRSEPPPTARYPESRPDEADPPMKGDLNKSDQIASTELLVLGFPRADIASIICN